jgi:hypothetical protein
MPPGPAPVARRGFGKRLLTLPTPLRHHGDDLVHLLDRQQRPEGSAVARLAASLPTGGPRFRALWRMRSI